MLIEMNSTQTQASAHHGHVSEVIMALMGIDRLAYIRSANDGVHTVFAADGTELAVFESHEEAITSIKQFNLTPVHLH